MKRITLLAMIMVISMSLTGCTKSAEPSVENQTPNIGTTDNQNSTDNQNPTDSQNSTETSIVDLEDAKVIALNDAKLSKDKVTFTKAEKSSDNGVEKYEIEFSYGNTKYEYEINAATGMIIESSSEVEK